jgi:hypothetical protein
MLNLNYSIVGNALLSPSSSLLLLGLGCLTAANAFRCLKKGDTAKKAAMIGIETWKQSTKFSINALDMRKVSIMLFMAVSLPVSDTLKFHIVMNLLFQGMVQNFLPEIAANQEKFISFWSDHTASLVEFHKP